MTTDEQMIVLINDLLGQITKECDELKLHIQSNDFPYHKSYTEKIAGHCSAICILTGKISVLQLIRNSTNDDKFNFDLSLDDLTRNTNFNK